MDALRAKSDFWIDDCDVYFPYDGFTIITLNWFENAGFCGAGRGGAPSPNTGTRRFEPRPDRRSDPGEPPRRRFRRWDPGSGTSAAVHQPRNARVTGRSTAERAIVTAGGFFFNAQAVHCAPSEGER